MAASDTNRVRLSSIEEVTLGVTPDTPRMRRGRMTGESLQYQPAFTQSGEIRDDRMNADPSKTNETNQGAINGELSFPPDLSPFSSWLKSLFFNPWVNTPSRDNDSDAASIISDVSGTGGVITVTAGAAFVVGQLVRASGFGVAANNGLFKVTTGSGTVPAFAGQNLADEAAPAATARLKVVGFEGAAGDVVAVADGLTSTTLDFTTLGLAVGQWIKIGGSGAAYRFATAAANGWARIIGVAAHKLTLDNLPTGWAADVGAAKTIRVFFGDTLKNGTTMFSNTLERGFMAQPVPSYIIQRGMVAGQGEFSFEAEQLAAWSLTFNGMTGEVATASLDDAPDAPTTNRIMSAAVNVGRIAENGVAIGGPNFVRSMRLTVNNNLRMLSAIRDDGLVGPVDIGAGSCDVTVALETYFGSATLLQKLFQETATNVNARITKDKQAMIFGLPRLTFTDGSVSAGAKNQDAMLPLTATASYDTLTGAHVLLDRLEYFEV